LLGIVFPHPAEDSAMAHQQTAKGMPPHTPAPVQVWRFPAGIDGPADWLPVLDAARARGAEANVLAAPADIPDREYGNPVAASREVGKFD
jgi:hypothetical protein